MSELTPAAEAVTTTTVTQTKETFVEKIEHVGEDIAKAVEYPILFAEKAEKVIGTAIKNDPAVKAILLSLVTQAESVAKLTAADVAEKGLNFADDEATLAAVEAFFTYVKVTVIPGIEAIYGQIKVDVTE